MYAWEPNPHLYNSSALPEGEWWGDLPAAIREKVRFYHDFVGEGDDGAPRPPNSFLGVLAAAKPDDFVAVKVDIDTPAAELAIVQALAEDPQLASLVDELYFEYHFYFDGLDFGWRDHVSGDVDTAIGLMHRLRALGVRAHFWI